MCSLILTASKRAIAVILAKLITVVATISHLTQSFAYERFKSSMVSDDGIVLLAVLCLLHTGLTHFPFVFIFIFFQMPVPKRQQSLLIGWVTDGIDHCRVGFLPHHLLVRRAHFYSGRLVQVVEMLADSENPHKWQYSRHNLGAWKAVMIDTLADDNVAANGLRGCCMDDIAQSTMQEGETKNDDDNKEFLSARSGRGRKNKKIIEMICTIDFQMLLVDRLSCQCCPSQDRGALQVEVQFFPHFRLELIETLQQHVIR